MFRSLSSTDVDPAQLQAQRNRARQLASLIKEIENREESVSYETSELVPRRLWINVKDALNLSSDLDVVLTRLLDDVDTGVYDRGQMATQALVFRRLADQLNDVGRGGLVEASSERPELGHVAGV
ncbi:MAG: hypothetical protein OSA99_12190 [Acidimicrobiales bacterium]|nr:hypothetical protein [Acidimicrobiales bacterium]